MTSTVIPFLLSMMLGRTIDLRTYNIGTDLFDHSDYNETAIQMLNSTYTMLQENVFPYTYIGLPADIVLRIKTNKLSSASGSMGLDGLLRETSWHSRSIVIAVTSLYQTVYRELRDDARMVPDWTNRIDRQQTHYAASLYYGGWSVVLYRYRCSSPADEEIVRNILQSNLGITGLMNEETVEKWNGAMKSIKYHKDLTDEVKVFVERYSSVRMAQDLSTPDLLLKGIQKFQKDVGNTGLPLFMEMKPLHKLDTRYPDVRENHELDQDMEKLDELFDDLRIAKGNVRHWLSSTLVEFTPEDEQRITDLFDYVSRCLTLFTEIASKASVYNPVDANYLKSAFIMYSKGLPKTVSSYQMLFRRMKEELDPMCKDTFGHKIRGTLKVNDDEKLEMGEMKGGLEQCKEECLEEDNCRAIGYADEISVMEYSIKKKGFEIVKKFKQCLIYFRSSLTATVIPSKVKTSSEIYDRDCIYL